MAVRVLGVNQAVAAALSIPVKVNTGSRVALTATARFGQQVVQQNASGRPGPNVIDDVYRPSIMGVVRSEGGNQMAEIGSGAAQTLRLEFGFFGRDSLGRVYNQPAFPHFQPAVNPVSTFAAQIATSSIRAALTF